MALNPKSVADIRRRFTQVIVAVADHAQTVSGAWRNTARYQPPQFDKNGWSGDVFDAEGQGKPFDRSEHDADMLAVIRDKESPGVVGDLQLITLQGDYLAAMERAQRCANTRRCRALAHASARKRGHGHAGGLFRKGILGALKRLSRLSKDKGKS